MTIRPEILRARLNENSKNHIVHDAYATPRHTEFRHGQNENNILVTNLDGEYTRILKKLALVKTANSVKHLQPNDSRVPPEVFAIADEIRVNKIFRNIFTDDDPYIYYNAKEINNFYGSKEQLRISQTPIILESARVHGTTAHAKLMRQISSPILKPKLSEMHKQLRKHLNRLKHIGTCNEHNDSLDYHIFITEQLAQIIMHFINNQNKNNKLNLSEVIDSCDIDNQKWCKLAVTLPKLELNHNGRMNRKKRPNELGRTPKHLHRLLTDPNRRIFSKKAKSLGGTVVIDCSGSMDLTEQQIIQMVKSASGSTIWAYSSSCHYDDLENCWLLAHNGKSVRTLPQFHGGNGVDLPALAHAYRTKRNRNDLMIWISDGRVTGNGDASNRSLRISTANFIRKFNIHHVETVSEAIELLSKTQKGSAGQRKISNWEINTLAERR